MATIDLPRSKRKDEEHEPNRLAGIALAILALLLAVLLLATNPRLLVSLTSDREGDPLLPASTLAPGTSTTGDITLANEGLLPLKYSLQVKAGEEELHSGVTLKIARKGARTPLYLAPLTANRIELGTLAPGQHDDLEVTLQARKTAGTSSIPVDDTFVWTGNSPDLGYWWWLLALALLLGLLAFALPRAFDLYARLRRIQPLPFELYWRPLLILAILLLAALMPLSGVSLSTVNAQTLNPGNRFAIGDLALSDRSPTGSTCISVSGTAAPAPNARGSACDAIFNFGGGRPGSLGQAFVTIRNAGTVPVSKLELSTPGCSTQDAPTEKVHGTGQLCPWVYLAIHDETHDTCYFPVLSAGACPLPPGSPANRSLQDFAQAHPQPTPLELNPDGLGAGITYSFLVELNPAAGNDVQGRATDMAFVWSISQ